jgi:hypothetical protein
VIRVTLRRDLYHESVGFRPYSLQIITLSNHTILADQIGYAVAAGVDATEPVFGVESVVEILVNLGGQRNEWAMET